MTKVKTILVTGAHGFIGRNLARCAAAQGYRVEGIGHGNWRGKELSEWGLAVWKASDVDLDALRQLGSSPAIIFHCAGGSSVSASFEDPLHDFQRTVASTAAVLEFARHTKPVARVVLLSSAAVYGVAERVPIAETETPKPISPDGNHKRLAEELAVSYATHFGVPVSIVRLFSVYGEGLRKQLFWDACLKIRANRAQFEGKGDELRDWLHIEDAVKLLFIAGERTEGGILLVNGACGKGVQVREAVSELSKALGAKAAPTFSGKPLPGYPPRFVADVSRAGSLGFRPSVLLADGLR